MCATLLSGCLRRHPPARLHDDDTRIQPDARAARLSGIDVVGWAFATVQQQVPNHFDNDLHKQDSFSTLLGR